jgi:hypothetical protein
VIFVQLGMVTGGGDGFEAEVEMVVRCFCENGCSVPSDTFSLWSC